MNSLIFAVATIALSCATVAAPARAEPRPVVVELFTSQGCSSCPPADAVLAELAQRKGVLALGFHVDYWDGLGWRDPLSAAGSTARQHGYAAQFGKKEIYTPQIVVDGRSQLVGSNREAVLQAITQSQPQAAAPVTFAVDGRSVAIGAGTGQGKIILIRFIRHRTNAVQAGENAGRMANDANGVETFKTVGEWTGQTIDLPMDPVDANHGLAVLIQANDGHILGAASLLAAQS
ncbi:MAG: uncharacterized protein JWM91_2059 [Rhodospirillales bacterium]|nr:uncharacterized protein [Rhodospirillales bacterium]